jgi:ZIP family zinc transporter
MVLAVSFGGSFLWGAVAASSLLIGALIAMELHISVRMIGTIMGFGAGVLISAVAFDLVEDSYELAGGGRAVGLGLIAGCATSLPATS